jgi:hypothetical protein
MNGRGFRSVMWVAAIGAAALICYMFSMRVAEERAGLAELESQIRRAEQSIRTLKTELGTRSRVHQLQHWASADFGFAAPNASQFLQDEVTLANLDMPPAAPAIEAPVAWPPRRQLSLRRPSRSGRSLRRRRLPLPSSARQAPRVPPIRRCFAALRWRRRLRARSRPSRKRPARALPVRLWSAHVPSRRSIAAPAPSAPRSAAPAGPADGQHRHDSGHGRRRALAAPRPGHCL